MVYWYYTKPTKNNLETFCKKCENWQKTPIEIWIRKYIITTSLTFGKFIETELTLFPSIAVPLTTEIWIGLSRYSYFSKSSTSKVMWLLATLSSSQCIAFFLVACHKCMCIVFSIGTILVASIFCRQFFWRWPQLSQLKHRPLNTFAPLLLNFPGWYNLFLIGFSATSFLSIYLMLSHSRRDISIALSRSVLGMF